MSSLLRFRSIKKLYSIPYVLESSFLGNFVPIFSSGPKIRFYASPTSSTSTDRGSPVSLPPQRRPAWLDQPEKPSSSGEQSLEGRFAINPASTAEKFRQFLEILRKREPIPEWAKSAGDAGGIGEAGGDRKQYKSILYTAPYLAELYGFGNEFADVVSEWFYQTRPLFLHDTRRGEITVSLQFSPNVDQSSKWKRTMTPVFNIAHHIEHLGRLNKLTEGRLVENLEWRNVSFLARRMMECGFFTYTFLDVCGSALNGLVDLYLSNPNPPNRLVYGEGLRLWLLALAHFLAAAESKPYEWRHLIGELGANQAGVPGMVDSLRRLHASFLLTENAMPEKTNVVFKYLFKTLCNYARIHFDDDVVEDCRLAMERGRISAQLNVPRVARFLTSFAEAWTRFQPKQLAEIPKWAPYLDPNYFVRGTWDSWFQACNVVFSQLLLTDQYFKDTLSTGKAGKREEPDMNEKGERSLNKNYSYLRSLSAMRLMDAALAVAFEFDDTSSFYQHLFDTWIKFFNRSESNLSSREKSFVIPRLIRIAVNDAHVPDNEKETDQNEGNVQSSPILEKRQESGIQPQQKAKEESILVEDQSSDPEPIWRDRHEKTVKLALDLLKNAEPNAFSLRTVHQIVTEFSELQRVKKSDDRVFEELLAFMQDWIIAKGRKPKPLSPGGAKTVGSIKETIQEMKLEPENVVKEVIRGLDGMLSW